MAKRTALDLKDLRGARVFVRVDYNVPLEFLAGDPLPGVACLADR